MTRLSYYMLLTYAYIDTYIHDTKWRELIIQDIEYSYARINTDHTSTSEIIKSSRLTHQIQ